jgi:hypothetical protein
MTVHGRVLQCQAAVRPVRRELIWRQIAPAVTSTIGHETALRPSMFYLDPPLSARPVPARSSRTNRPTAPDPGAILGGLP